MCKKLNEQLKSQNSLVGGIYDSLLKQNYNNSGDALLDASVWIAELQLQLNSLTTTVSSGYVRKDTSKIKWKSKSMVPPVDSGDAWIRTGVTSDG